MVLTGQHAAWQGRGRMAVILLLQFVDVALNRVRPRFRVRSYRTPLRNTAVKITYLDHPHSTDTRAEAQSTQALRKNLLEAEGFTWPMALEPTGASHLQPTWSSQLSKASCKDLSRPPTLAATTAPGGPLEAESELTDTPFRWGTGGFRGKSAVLRGTTWLCYFRKLITHL